MSRVLRPNPGSSVFNFIVVMIVSLAVLGGSIFVVRNRSEQARRDQAIATTSQQTTDQSESTDSSQGTAKDSDNAQSETVAVPEVLPTTGMSQVIGQSIGIYALVFALAEYLISNRMTRRDVRSI